MFSFSELHIICFAAFYLAALGLELVRLWRGSISRLLLVGVVAVGLLIHALHLGARATLSASSPLSSPYDWYLLAAWVLAAVYLLQLFYDFRSAMGLFLAPTVLALAAAAHFAQREPFVVERASRTWGNIHGASLLMGTVTVMIGFLAGVMYLTQSHRLKQHRPPSRRLRLPSLEWLEKVNSRSLGVSAFFIGVGFFSGVILNQIRHAREQDYLPWTDPVILSLAVMLAWLVIAEVFRLTYRAARGGRKVAYLTVATFVFLVISLVVLLAVDTGHRPAAGTRTATESNLAVAAPGAGGRGGVSSAPLAAIGGGA